MSFFEAIEPIFRTYVLGNAPVKQIASGFDWTEGPVWFDVGENGALGGGDVFHVVRPGAADGFRLDCDGNLWHRPRTVCTASVRGGRCSARSWCPSRSPTCASAGAQSTGSSSPPRTPCIAWC